MDNGYMKDYNLYKVINFKSPTKVPRKGVLKYFLRILLKIYLGLKNAININLNPQFSTRKFGEKLTPFTPKMLNDGMMGP